MAFEQRPQPTSIFDAIANIIETVKDTVKNAVRPVPKPMPHEPLNAAQLERLMRTKAANNDHHIGAAATKNAVLHQLNTVYTLGAQSLDKANYADKGNDHSVTATLLADKHPEFSKEKLDKVRNQYDPKRARGPQVTSSETPEQNPSVDKDLTNRTAPDHHPSNLPAPRM
jgi:hypothetical protein